jgi:hypothetical protein
MAIESLIADGEYGRILDKWGVSDIAIDAPRINGATE